LWCRKRSKSSKFEALGFIRVSAIAYEEVVLSIVLNISYFLADFYLEVALPPPFLEVDL